MRQNVKSPFPECLYFVLLLRDNDSHLRLLHPFQFAFHFLYLLLIHASIDLFLQSSYFFLPIDLHIVIHAYTSHLVVTNKHSLTGCPQITVMTHKILGDHLQAFGCCQQMYFLGKFTFQLCLLRSIYLAGLFQYSRYLFIDFRILQILQPFTTILIIQRNGCFIIYRPFKIVDAYITTESSGRYIVVAQQGSTGESDTVGCR